MSRVLVVDDDPNVRQLVSIRLQKAGHGVCSGLTAAPRRWSRSRSAARRRGRARRDDARHDGAGAAPALRSLDGLDDLPAIFLSGRVEHHDVEAGRALNATYLTKPFSGQALTGAIERLSVGVGW